MAIYSVIWNQTKDSYERADVVNFAPTIQVDTPNNKTLYEGDTLILKGYAKDVNVDDILTVRYRVNGVGSSRPITTSVSDGKTSIPFEKTLTYTNGSLYDGGTLLLENTEQGKAYSIQVWSEDDSGEKSEIHDITFYSVPNRPPKLTINSIVDKDGLVDSDNVIITGDVSDPDGNAVVVEFSINDGEYIQAFGNGESSSGEFNIEFRLDKLMDGDNTIRVRAKDTYDFTDTRTITMTKTHNAVPLKDSVARYIVTPPTGQAKEVLLWIQRTIDGLDVSAEVSLTTDLTEAENFIPLDHTVVGAPVVAGIVEDEFTVATDTPKERIVLKVNIGSGTTDTEAAINLIAGVLA